MQGFIDRIPIILSQKNRIATLARYNHLLMIDCRIVDQFIEVGSRLSNIQCCHIEILFHSKNAERSFI